MILIYSICALAASILTLTVFLWTRQPVVNPYTEARVDALKAYCETVVDFAIQRDERIEVADKAIPFLRDTPLYSIVSMLVTDARRVFPGFNIEVLIAASQETIRVSEPVLQPMKLDLDVGVEDPDLRGTFCRYAVASGKSLVIDDSATDLIVCDSPHVPQVRSYFGAPIVVDHEVVGVFCVYGPEIHDWSHDERTLVEEWADLVSTYLTEVSGEGVL